MVRIKRGNVARKRRNKILSIASGYRGAHSVLFRVANQQVMKALRYSYIGRKEKKRIFRRIWISRINAGSRLLKNLPYSKLINKFKRSNIYLNRKMLSQIAIIDNPTFSGLIEATLSYAFMKDREKNVIQSLRNDENFERLFKNAQVCNELIYFDRLIQDLNFA